MSRYLKQLDPRAIGLKLHRIKNRRGELAATELVIFRDGVAAVDAVLRRAAISGAVTVEPGALADHWADVYIAENEWTQSIGLDRHSYAALKNKWMRCRLEGDTRR